MTKPNSREMPNDKAQMTNQAQSSNVKREAVLAFSHLDFV
jgi:hypothetical protein